MNFGYASQGLGINATLRRMENMSFFSDREAQGNLFNQNIVNFIPALTKQHDYLLTNIYVYQAQPSVVLNDASNLAKAGEIGGQFDIYYNLNQGTALGGKYGTELAMNTSYWANLSGDYDFVDHDYEVDYLGFGKKLSDNWSTIFTYVNQYYNKKYIEERSGIIETNIAVAEATYIINEKQSVHLVGQHLWTQDDHQDWGGGTLEFNASHKLSFYVSDVYNYGNDIKEERIHYYNVGGSFTKGANRFSLNYGRQRGGVVCVGGVCRYVPESTGLSASISISF